MKQKQVKAEHQVTLKRPDGYYMADNEMVTVFAPLIGPFAFAVYHLLKQRSFMKEKDRGISHLGISRAMAMSKDSVGNALKTLKQFYLVEELPPTAPNHPPRYEVVHAKDVITEHPEFRTPETDNPQLAQNPQEHPENRTRVRTIRILKTGRGVDGIQDGDGLNSGRTHPEFRTPNKEEVLKEKKEKDKDSNPPTPQGGRNPIQVQEQARARFEAAGSLAQDGAMTSVADMVRNLKLDEDPDPRVLARSFLEYLHDEFARGFSAAHSQARGKDWEDPLDIWNRCFAHVGVGDVEVPEGAATGLVVMLLTPKPKDLAYGLTKFQAKVQIAMKKAFGREVQLVPRLEAA